MNEHRKARQLTWINIPPRCRGQDGAIAAPQRPIMTPDNTTLLKTQLLEKRDSLLEQLYLLRGGNLTRAQASASHFAQPEDSQAQTTTEKDLEFALDGHETDALEAVEAALQRIAEGRYGRCIDCGLQIAPARLQATPEAARCIHCQEKAESA
jgi:DnaK suppressor protein